MLALRAGRRAARAVGCRKAVTLYSAKLRGAEDFGHLLADNFRLAPTAAAEFIVENLEPQDRLSLLQALTRAEGPLASSLDDKYVADLLRSADRQADGALEQAELKTALMVDRALVSGDASWVTQPNPAPSLHALSSVALAAGLPFLGFGFLDNAIMIIAGDEIELVFGARMGLSTLAAAGLGNLVSDIAGLGFANQIEAQARKRFRARPLTSEQMRMFKTRAAKLSGSVVGLTIGCLLGMTPLLVLEPH